MSGLRIIKYFKGPAFTADIWSGRNPYLKSGEIGYLLAGGITTGAKVGPGYWNDLGFIGEDVYPYTTDVTNPIGDATGNLEGETLIDIINKMLSPYEVPDLSNIQNNAGGTYDVIRIREVGQTLSGSISVIYNVLNSQNLLGATPINMTAAGVFSNEGNFANSGNISLSLAAPLSPTTPQTITIALKATHTNGQTNDPVDITQIIFKPRIMWVSSVLDAITLGTTFMSISGRQFILSSDYKLDYAINGNGYTWIAIPSMLNPTSMIFADITNPAAPADYAMENKGTISINNGVGTYNYVLFRSTYSLINANKLRIQ